MKIIMNILDNLQFNTIWSKVIALLSIIDSIILTLEEIPTWEKGISMPQSDKRWIRESYQKFHFLKKGGKVVGPNKTKPTGEFAKFSLVVA